MLHTQELTSEKYLKHVWEEEKQDLRRARNRKAIRDFNTFLFGIFMIPVAIYAAQKLPEWLPTLQTYPIFRNLLN